MSSSSGNRIGDQGAHAMADKLREKVNLEKLSLDLR